MPELATLTIADDPEAWSELGFSVGEDATTVLGGVHVTLGAEGRGVVSVGFRGLGAGGPVEGLSLVASDAPAAAPVEHPLGVTAIDHLVVLTPDTDRTFAALEAAGFELRRTRDAEGPAGAPIRQGFYVVGEALLEVAGPRAEGADGPATVWGITLVVDDLDASARFLGVERIGRVKDAVQAGRRIATVRKEAGLGVALALMTPRG